MSVTRGVTETACAEGNTAKYSSPVFASLQHGSAQKDILQHSQWHSGGKGSESRLEQANREGKPAHLKTTVWSQTGGMATGSGTARRHGTKSQPVPALFCPLSLPKACTRPPTSGRKWELIWWGLEVLLPVEQAVSLRAPHWPSELSWCSVYVCSLDVAWCHWGEALGAPVLSTPLLHWLPDLLVADTTLGPQWDCWLP